MILTDFPDTIKTLLIITSVILNISPSYSQSCEFNWNALNRGSGPGLSSGGSGSRYKKPYKDKTECPCFHAEKDKNCPSTSNAFSPLIDCAYLPREFIECAEPFDHAGNQTARDKLGYGCLKVCYKLDSME